MYRRYGYLLGLVILGLAWGLAAQTEPRFRLPVACTLGQDCFVMLYVDRDPGPGERDFGCGRQTYDGHQGTDIAVADAAVRKAVVAAAPGRVLRVRDGVPDRLLRDRRDPRVRGQECGNGVVVDLGNDWEAQYCHLRQNTIAVRPGQTLQTGDRLGEIGLSGATSFPHVHFEVRYRGQTVDPFVGLTTATGCPIQRRSLWQADPGYVPTGAIAGGFHGDVPAVEAAEMGQLNATVLPATAPVLTFWARAYGALAGDVETLKLVAPDGRTVAHRTQTLIVPNRQRFGFVGQRNRDRLAIGRWRGEYTLQRQGQTLVRIQREVAVR
ncbi:MAG: M23 family metallopeptidase [Oscillatoriales cyanobacterium SM2_1_8]|nr:M23 family metallopeptidase [Oscillatoriales cyanobacterium SM2_1_8]